jgi:predicted transcriptional regulator of viral defense system
MPTYFIDSVRVHATFSELQRHVFSPSELLDIVRQHQPSWLANIPSMQTDELSSIDEKNLWSIKSLGAKTLADLITKHKVLKRISLPFPHRGDQRYIYGTAPTLDVIQSLDQAGYFSHFTAIFLNGLTDQIPKTIYFNVEQNFAGGGSPLTQDSLDRAFAAKPRMSSNSVQYDGQKIYKLNGRNTGRLGVGEIQTELCTSKISVTNIERTLIDATVRPSYSGGVSVVASAFESAKGHMSANKIAAYLRKLKFAYPYHQAIGFYMERAGYEEPQLRYLQEFPIKFDFYLAHGMKTTQYNKKWRLFVPKGF